VLVLVVVLVVVVVRQGGASLVAATHRSAGKRSRIQAASSGSRRYERPPIFT
jgi:hypothetical protein